jgi:hypothetical protein
MGSVPNTDARMRASAISAAVTSVGDALGDSLATGVTALAEDPI